MTASRRRSLVERLESTNTGQLDMAAARAAVGSVALINRVFVASSMSQHDLAEKLGVTDGRVSQVLNADGNVRVSTLARFLRACGYRLRLAAEPAGPGVKQLVEPPRRTATPARTARYAALKTVTCITDDGVGQEPVIQLSSSHPRQFFGEVYEAVLDMETGELEAAGPVRPSPKTLDTARANAGATRG